jgi:hypothetical protein
MSKIQNFIKKFLPASWAESMEKESREWMMQCNSCGFERSVWDTGGIRWKAAGEPIRYMLCGSCGTLTGHRTYKKTA